MEAPYNLYEVERLEDVLGNDIAINKLRNFAREINRGVACTPLLLYGPTGTGKSISASLLAQENGWNVAELNASDYRDKETVDARLTSAATSRSLFGKKNLILLDEIDEMVARFDKGGSSAIGALIGKSKNPIIFIANDMWDQSISFLRGKTEPVQFIKLQPDSTRRVLERVLNKHSLKAEKTVVDMIANRANGDARSAINDLSVVIGAEKGEELTEAIGLRDRKIDVFYMLDRIFTTNTLSSSLKAVAGTDITNDMLIKWLDENVPKRYKYSDDMYDAFDALSMASTFLSRAMHSQYYTYWRYANVYMSSGVALAKRHQPEARIAYSFPRVIKELSGSKAARGQDKLIAEKLKRVFHTSTSKIIRNEMRMLSQIVAKAIAENKDGEDEIKEQLMRTYQLESKEVDYMLGRVN